jgi:hypothetical protein
MFPFGYIISPMEMVSRVLFASVLLVAAYAAPVPARAAELVMFEAGGCTWCRTWHEVIGPIYPRTEEGRIAPLRRVDKDGPRPDDLRHVEGIVFTPTFVVVEAGREVGRITGYPGEDFFWGLVGQIVAKVKSPDLSGS